MREVCGVGLRVRGGRWGEGVGVRTLFTFSSPPQVKATDTGSLARVVVQMLRTEGEPIYYVLSLICFLM